MLLRAAAAVSFAVLCPSLAEAGDVRGTIVIERKLTRANVTASAGVYQRGTAVPLGLDAESDPLIFERSHVAVYVEGPAKAASKPVQVVIEQRERRFTPDLVVIPAGSTVSFPNFDPIFHNVFSLSKAKNFDLGNYPKGATRVVTFSSPGIVAVYCHLHPNMAASIVVTPNAWTARAAANGSFTLKDLPPGTYTVVAWHKAAGTFRQTVTVGPTGDAEVKFTLPYVDSTPSGSVAHR
jgi:plastocyanin